MYCRKSSESDERQIQSLPDQITNLTDLIHQRGVELIGEPLQEQRTAKVPGRPVFGRLVQMVEDGEINGIVLLNPSRLSRNTVDTGRIIYLMDQGKLLEVVTPYQTFRNNPNDKFMLNLLCTQAKLENDNKSVNITEALKLKAERGVFPGRARPGYKNNHEKPQGLRDISTHPVYFPLMRKLFDLALTGNYSVQALLREAKILGIRSLKSGKPIVKSAMYRMLRDPFYTGRFMYNGKLYSGQHPAMLTDAEFNLLQDILDGRSKGRLQKHDFALNGIMKCGECHYCITAQEHTKKYKNGTQQTFGYYCCTKKGEMKCDQPYTSTKKLEGQFADDLFRFRIKDTDKEFIDWAYEALEETKDKNQTVNKSSYEALQTALDGVNRRIDNLIALKISPTNDGSLLSDTEFSDRKRGLMMEKETITRQLAQCNPNSSDWAEVARDAFEFALLAKNRFENGDSEDKKVIFKAIGVNPILLDQKLKYQPRFIFLKIEEGVKNTNEEIDRRVPEKSPIDRANLENYLKNSLWCSRQDLGSATFLTSPICWKL
jgi:DNA invertase Pin-like site-specific DNA recombinase